MKSVTAECPFWIIAGIRYQISISSQSLRHATQLKFAIRVSHDPQSDILRDLKKNWKIASLG